MLTKYCFLLLICSQLFLTACSFTSQSRSITPYFDGQLLFNNNPIENTKIMLSIKAGDKYCLNTHKTSTTNNQGKFSLKAATEEYTYTPFADKQLDEWTVCAKYNGDTYTLYSNNRYGAGHVSGSIYLQCDLALNPTSKPCTISH